MNLDEGIQVLKSKGLNIFLSAKVRDIPKDIYDFSDEDQNKTLVLLGHGGKALWEVITDKSIPDPVDSFCVNQMNQFAKNYLNKDIEILFPNDKEVLPLQKLGRFFNLSYQSPLGIDISHEYGLWFAFRGVFLTAINLPETILRKKVFPCEECTDKPCLTTSDIFDARMMCPVKKEHQYSLEQLNYHRNIILDYKIRN